MTQAGQGTSTSPNSLFGCIQALCGHHHLAMSLTPESLDAAVAGRSGLAAAEAALARSGFATKRAPLAGVTLAAPDRSSPLLAMRRRGGFVLIVGVRGSGGKALIGVYSPEEGPARARPWTRDLALRALAGEVLEVEAARPPRPARDLGARITASASPVKTVPRRRHAMADIYADAFENILVHGGTVRIDLATYSPGDRTDDDQPALEMTGRLVMPIEGFVRAFGGMGEVVRQMTEAGVIEPIGEPEGGHAGGHD